MKKGIHPKYYENAEVVCACGNRFYVGSTKPIIKIEVCSACHPHFTGAEKFIDKAGRVDKFQLRMSRYEEIAAEKRRKEKEKAKKLKEAEILLRQRRR